MAHPQDQTPHPNGPGVYVNVDVAHAGALWSRDPDITWEALSQLEGLLTTMVEDLGGELVGQEGDAFVIRFDTAPPAIMWCARMQEGLLALDWPDALSTPGEAGRNQEMLYGGLLASMAIHNGALDVLSGLVSLAQPGQVFITAETWATVHDPVPPDLQIRPIGTVDVLGASIEILQVTTRLLSRRRFNDLVPTHSRIPLEPDCFIGRAAAMADLMERLDAGARMVNITGPEGIGKTRIAMQCIRRVEADCPGGVALVSLRDTQDITEVLLATAAALGMALGDELSGTITERIGNAIASRGRSIILFDGFESHLDSGLLNTWIRTASDARFLVTGQTPILSERATHLHLGKMNDFDGRALFLARSHRCLREQERHPRATQIQLTECISEGIATNIEKAAGVTSPRWDVQSSTTLQLRRLVLDESEPPTARVNAALEAVPLLLKMGLIRVAKDLLQTVEPILESTELNGSWQCTMADTLIASRDWEAAQQFLHEPERMPSTETAQSAWLLRHGQLALAEERFSDAKTVLDQAAALDDSPAIALARGRALHAMDEWEDAVIWLEQAAGELKDPMERAHALCDLGRTLQDLGREQDGEAALTEAMRLGTGDPHLQAHVHHHRFQGAAARLDLTNARQHLLRELDCLRRCGDQAGHARSHIQLGLLDLIQHDPSAATPHFHTARDLCREGGLGTLEAQALTMGGIAARLSGDFGTALDAFAEAAALAEGQHELLAIIHAHRGAVEAACDAVDNAVVAFDLAETHLEAGWDALANTIHDVLAGFIDLARARDAALTDDEEQQAHHVDAALNRLARASSFETRSTPPRGREVPSRINELRLARLLLDGALSALEPAE
jgi:tetratricopeptide (TPR) repeat protein